MAVAHAFSPKEFTCWIISDATNAGSSGIHASNMHQLDVDSVGYPSLNVTQALDVRNGVGRTFKDEDFFQDNTLRVTELSLSGTLHNDTGHNLLVQNITNDTSGDAAVASGHTGTSQKYGAAVTNAASSLTVVIKSSDHTNQRSLEFAGMVVTNFSINADAGTEGGRYKFSATLQSGKKPDLNESTTACGNTVYANTTHSLLSSASGIKVFNTDVIMNSFTATIDHPAVFTGLTSTGYEVVSRGAECAVTVDTQVKYDGETKTFVNSFDTQTAARSGDMFVMVNNNAYGVDVQNGIFTNVAYSEGDIMMLDCSIKAVDDGTDALISFDLSS
tara:strand:+ start:4989 stop:5981 length:993 start_codon:yes stop_codon:yes gene_type:complete